MAKQIINLSVPGGDTPFNSNTKVKAMFTELYNFLANASSGVDVVTTLPATLPVAKGGTGVATLAALVTALNAQGSYSRTNILGTVSQASGVPTGAAMQYITNSNGQAIRFADGTQIAARAIGGGSLAPGGRQSGLTGAWAAAFASVPYAIPAITSSYPDYMSVNNESSMTASTYACSVQNRNAPVAVTPTVYVIAVGRWY